MTGVWWGIVAIVMLFAALTSVFFLRNGVSAHWMRTSLPPILYLNSTILLVSGLTLEFSRTSLSAGLPARFFLWLYTTLALGIAFIAGQLTAWRELVRNGVYLATFPGGSFFYLITGAHALHLLGGIIALTVLAVRAPKIARGFAPRTLLDGTALYWHFMYALWMYILLVLILTG
jgi:cytochrome c oxidase subunit III